MSVRAGCSRNSICCTAMTLTRARFSSFSRLAFYVLAPCSSFKHQTLDVASLRAAVRLLAHCQLSLRRNRLNPSPVQPIQHNRSARNLSRCAKKTFPGLPMTSLLLKLQFCFRRGDTGHSDLFVFRLSRTIVATSMKQRLNRYY